MEVIGWFNEDFEATLTNSAAKGEAAIIAAHFGQGKVVVFGPRPEMGNVEHTGYLLVNAVEWIIS